MAAAVAAFGVTPFARPFDTSMAALGLRSLIAMPAAMAALWRSAMVALTAAIAVAVALVDHVALMPNMARVTVLQAAVDSARMGCMLRSVRITM